MSETEYLPRPGLEPRDGDTPDDDAGFEQDRDD